MEQDLSEFNYLLDGIPSNGKVLAIDFNSWAPHVSTTLELARILTLSGRKVSYSQILPVGSPTFERPFIGKIGIVNLEHLNEYGIDYLQSKSKMQSSALIDNKVSKMLLERIKSVRYQSQLIDINWGNFDVGYAILSTLVSRRGESKISSKELRLNAPNLLERYISTVNFFSDVFTKEKYDAVIVFNGRFLCERALWRTAEHFKIPVVFHEALWPRPAFTAEFSSPHSLEGYRKMAERLISKYDQKEISEAGDQWFKARLNNSSPDTASFQKKWLTHVDSKFRDPFISVFPTSDDEFIAISSNWDLPNRKSQVEFIKEIVQLATQNDWQVVVRLHPNLANKSRKLTKEWMRLSKIANVSVIEPRSPLSSYDLAKLSSLVITCGSTIAAESGYLGKPVLSVGTGIYDALNLVVKLQNLKDIGHLLESGDFQNLVPNMEQTKLFGFIEARKFHTRNFLIEKDLRLLVETALPRPFVRLISYACRRFAYRFLRMSKSIHVNAAGFASPTRYIS